MAEPKDNNTSFFRKVVKFVANPATDWTSLEGGAADERETELAKSELKAMIERKRRNDFVRKREFDMLRKVRREGLTSEQLAALGGSSRLDAPLCVLRVLCGLTLLRGRHRKYSRTQTGQKMV